MLFALYVSWSLCLFVGFMQFFGVVFIITTTLVLVFKKEHDVSTHECLEDSLTLTQTYKLVWKILKLKSVQQLSILLLTFKVTKKTIYILS